MLNKLILVGGFLGSGKTTLLAEAAKRLAQQEKTVGLITNDQAPELVDTRLLASVGNGTNNKVAELSGSCFCCNFNGFVDSVKYLIGQGAETIIAEPVGSCTDLSATILNPLKKTYPDWPLAPLSVLVDSGRLQEIFGKTESGVEADALYIMERQLAEADRIYISKSDQLSETQRKECKTLLEEKYPNTKVGFLSSKNGEGLDDWLAEVQSAVDAGKTIVPVDYDRYAHGEAVLGWLNATATVLGGDSDGGNKLLFDLLSDMHAELKTKGLEVGHVKALLSMGGKEWVGNLTSLNGGINISEINHSESAMPSEHALLILNARVQTQPETLERLVRDILGQFDMSITSLRCLMPGRPVPTHRYNDCI